MLVSASAMADQCILDIRLGTLNLYTNVVAGPVILKSENLPMPAGYCDGSSGGGGIIGKDMRAYHVAPLVAESFKSANRVAGTNYLSSDYRDLLHPSGRIQVVASKNVNGVNTRIGTLNYFCKSDGRCALEPRPTCGLFRGGTDTATNMIASPNPATSVADTDAACIQYCIASGAKAGDLCMRHPLVIKKH